MTCPNCGCPFRTTYSVVTADMPQAWQDEDGTWYKGPARRDERSHCDNCGREVVRLWRRGKLEREDVVHHGRKPSS